MDALELARAQFAMTSIYHFFFVPVTIGTALLVAVLHTQWYRTRKEDYRRLTRFFGGLLLLSVAVGVVTGLVQEFQFGMDWSAYAKFVGDVFGAPLAMEGLAAFFLESTFLGVWVFGWSVLPRGLHLASAWAVAIGSALSAMFIIAANSWMQNPVGYEINASTGAPQLTSIGDVFSNPVFMPAYLHVLATALVYAGAVMLAVSAWHLRRGGPDAKVFHRTAKLAIWVVLIAALAQFHLGGKLGQAITVNQPMKVAAMEAQWETCQPCSFSLVQIGGYTPDDPPTKIIQIPYLLSWLATGDINGKVTGINELQAQYAQQYPSGDIQYYPDVFVQYWSMRAMAYFAGLAVLIALWGVFLLWRRRLDDARLFHRVATWSVFIPFVMGTAGWVLTENGRQPWIVDGLMLTKDGLSPSVPAAQIAVSMTVFFLLYAVLGIIAAVLMVRHTKRGLPPEQQPDDPGERERAPELAY